MSSCGFSDSQKVSHPYAPPNVHHPSQQRGREDVYYLIYVVVSAAIEADIVESSTAVVSISLKSTFVSSCCMHSGGSTSPPDADVCGWVVHAGAPARLRFVIMHGDVGINEHHLRLHSIGLLDFHWVRKTVDSMQILPASWQAAARSKRLDIHSRIPKKWLLSDFDLEKAERQRNLTGTFIESFLDDDEKNIIAQDSVSLTEKIKSRQYTAVAVTQAFCKTAAIAQQIVSLTIFRATQPIAVEILLTRPRIIVFTKSCSISQCTPLRN